MYLSFFFLFLIIKKQTFKKPSPVLRKSFRGLLLQNAYVLLVCFVLPLIHICQTSKPPAIIDCVRKLIILKLCPLKYTYYFYICTIHSKTSLGRWYCTNHQNNSCYFLVSTTSVSYLKSNVMYIFILYLTI